MGTSRYGMTVCVCPAVCLYGREGALMSIVRDVMSLALVLSGLVGAQILAFDKWLWSADPSHAYGLLGFAVVDQVLAVLLLWRVRFAMIGASAVATVQFGAMLVDAVAGQPTGVTSSAFKSYLLSDYSFVGLMIIQVSILVVALGSLTILTIHRHRPWTEFLRHGKR